MYFESPYLSVYTSALARKSAGGTPKGGPHRGPSGGLADIRGLGDLQGVQGGVSGAGCPGWGSRGVQGGCLGRAAQAEDLGASRVGCLGQGILKRLGA